jgi:DHA1 family multidrug resistance protein-like MFS transporter
VTARAASGWRGALGARVAGEGSAATLVIALGSGVASLAMNFWVPFLPLFLLEIGATSDANALFWASLATAGLGIGRLVSGPVWGVLSDRIGRKAMYVRALYFATLTTLIGAFATEPWHVAVAFACQGLFSGFIPAAVALTSVSVPEQRLSNSLGLVTAAQYLGNTIGPAIGAVLAVAFGLRGAIVAAAVMPAVAATLVAVMVPRDRPVHAAARDSDAGPGEEQAPMRVLLTGQFALAIFLYFFLFAAGQLIRLTTPIALRDMTGDDEVAGILGVAFSLAGVASVAGVLFVARRWVQPGGFAKAIAAGAVVTAVAHLLLAASGVVPVYVLWFCVISLVQGALIPATNTLIAGNAPRSRRGTAFGIAGSAQALAFMVGPMAAAAFAAVSLALGYVVLALLFFGVGALAFLCVREPRRAPV